MNLLCNISVVFIGLDVICVGRKDLFELIQSEILDSALAYSCMMEAQLFIFEELYEWPHPVLVVFGGGFLAL
jgi:hypothetical protein